MFNNKLLATLLFFVSFGCFAQTSAYYIVDIIGDGKSTETAFRPAVSIIPGIKYSATIANKADGSPKYSWGLVLVTVIDHSKVVQVPGTVKLLDTIKNVPVDPTVKTKIISDLNAKLIDTTSLVNTITEIDIISSIGKLQDPQFTSDKLK